MNAIQTSHLLIIKNPAFKKVIVYLALTFTLCIPFYYYIISAGAVEAGGGIYVIGLMWCPGLAALLTRLIFQRNLRGMGWGWGKSRYQVWSYLLPMVVSGRLSLSMPAITSLSVSSTSSPLIGVIRNISRQNLV